MERHESSRLTTSSAAAGHRRAMNSPKRIMPCRLLQRLVRGYFAATPGRAYDSRNPHAEQRKTPTGTHLSGGAFLTCRNSQPTFSGTPSTQVLTTRLGPSLPQVKPCTISPLHLGHRFVPALMPEPLKEQLQ